MEQDCHVEPVNKTITSEEMETASLVMLAVQGMGCRNCATRVRNSLIQVRGVIDAEVYHTSGVAEVIYNPNLITQAALLEAVARAGGDGKHEYQARLYG
ncbi:MAG TPA: heavy metal-associated domain-containing protein [Anaerolineales bacterium]